MAAAQKQTYAYECIEHKQNKHELFSFFAPAKELIKCVSINQKLEDEEGGYQRAASPARTQQIARFIDAGNVLPLSILITLEKKAVKVDHKKIHITEGKNSGWVIDGQHRLIGAVVAQSDIVLPVIAFIGLSAADQVQQFVTINKEAKGVPTSLYYSLLKRLPATLSPADTAKERAADIANRLKSDETSAFASKIVSTTAPKTGQISLVNFVRKVSPLVKEDTGLLGSYSIDDQAKIIDNFYLAARNVFGKTFEKPDSLFFQTIGFGAFFNFFPTLFSTTLKERQGFTVADVTEVLKILSHFNVDQWKTAGTGSAAEIAAGKDLIEDFKSLKGPAAAATSLKL